MAIPQIIKTLANKIRNVVHGKDVREYLAKGLEETANIADQAYKKAQDVIDKRYEQSLLATDMRNKLVELERSYAPEHANNKQAITELKANVSKNSGALYQQLLMKPNFGMGNNQIFARAENAPQGLAYVKFNDKDYIFILSKANDVTTWSIDERQRITCFELKTDGSYVNHTSFTVPLNLSHQGISAYVEDGVLWLYCGYGHGDMINNGKGYSKIEWKGANTTAADVQYYQLIGEDDCEHVLKDFNHATPCLSTDGKYIILALATTFEDNTRYIAVWDREKVESSANPLSVPHQLMFKIDPPPFKDSHIVQDIACDGHFIYIATSGIAATLAKCIIVYTLNGQRLGHFKVDGSLGEYESLTDSTYGEAIQMEMEGITIKDNELLILTTDVWQKNGNYTKRDKHIHRIFKSLNPNDGNPIDSGKQPIESPSRMHVYGAKNDISFPVGDAFKVAQWNETTKEMRKSFGYHVQNEFRIYDSNDHADNETYAKIKVVRSNGRAYTEVRASNSLENGSGINLYQKDDIETVGSPVIIYSLDETGTNSFNVRIQETGAWRPGVDGSQNLGTGTYRWDNIFAATSTITTSDERDKTEIADIDDTVLDAWERVNFKQFKYLEAVQTKGSENARIHIGVIAQQILDSFTQESLDPFAYGLLTRDEWDYQPEIRDENGVILEAEREAGYRLGVRATECLFLEMALMRRKIDSLTSNN